MKVRATRTDVGKWRKWSRVCQGLLIRFLFILHGVFSIYILFVNNNLQKIHILVVIPLGLLFCEGVVMCARNGREYRKVWPCGFFYIATLVPIIWVLELGLVEKRQEVDFMTNSTLSKLMGASAVSSLVPTSNSTAALLEAMDGRKFPEIGVIVGLILGRWITPRGALSRKELSALLLGYVANAADILEVLDSTESPGVEYNKNVTISILAVYSLALLQFSFVTTLTKKKKTKKGRVAPIETHVVGQSGNVTQGTSTLSGQRCSSLEDGGGGNENIAFETFTIEEEKEKKVFDGIAAEENGEVVEENTPPIDENVAVEENVEEKITNSDNADEEFIKIVEVDEAVAAEVCIESLNTNTTNNNIDDSPTTTMTQHLCENGDLSEEEITPHNGCCSCCHEEFPQIFVSLFMQDGPFLILRLFLVLQYQVINGLHLFFLCKNAIVTTLLVYRIVILMCEDEKESEK